jgi:hypothetical protein
VGRLNEAFDKIRGLAFRFDPNLDNMSSGQLAEFLSKSPLAKWEQEELKVATDKTEYYAKHIVGYLLSDTFAAYNNYGAYIRKNGIFIERSLHDKFHQVERLMIDALTEQQIRITQPQDHLDKWEKLAELDRKGRPLIEALEREVQGRLWSASSVR